MWVYYTDLPDKSQSHDSYESLIVALCLFAAVSFWFVFTGVISHEK